MLNDVTLKCVCLHLDIKKYKHISYFYVTPNRGHLSNLGRLLMKFDLRRADNAWEN